MCPKYCPHEPDGVDGDDGKVCKGGVETEETFETFREGVLGKANTLGFTRGLLRAFTLFESNKISPQW